MRLTKVATLEAAVSYATLRSVSLVLFCFVFYVIFFFVVKLSRIPETNICIKKRTRTILQTHKDVLHY